jgi:hypothetical protein
MQVEDGLDDDRISLGQLGIQPVADAQRLVDERLAVEPLSSAIERHAVTSAQASGMTCSFG